MSATGRGGAGSTADADTVVAPADVAAGTPHSAAAKPHPSVASAANLRLNDDLPDLDSPI
jgi:hypothetical protein